jgi:IMP dehydrogenase
MIDFRRVLSYNDVLLVPRYSGLDHVTDADIYYNYNNIKWGFHGLPLINAPMDTVCSTALLKLLHDKFLMPVTIHRWFKSVEDQIKFYNECNFSLEDYDVFIAIGNLCKWEGWIERLLSYRRSNDKKFSVLIDVANGDTKATIETVKYIKSHYDVNIMAGNIATKSSFARLQESGADFIRVGIGGGSICETRTRSGFGVPTLTSVIDCAKEKSTSYLVADGGISYPGDICKAIANGADMVMCGNLFASTSLSSGEKVELNGKKYVRYHGMASKESIIKLNSNKSVVSIEGVSGLIPYTGETETVVTELLGNLQTAVSYYGGCRNWYEFRRRVKMNEITNAGWEESKTRVL